MTWHTRDADVKYTTIQKKENEEDSLQLQWRR